MKTKILLSFFIFTLCCETKAQNTETIEAAYRALNIGNDEQAFKIFSILAEQGDAQAQNELGECYFHGKGTTESITEAIKWYRKAAEQGVSNAQFKLGGFYLLGWGTSASLQEGIMWLVKSAEQGNEDAFKIFKALHDDSVFLDGLKNSAGQGNKESYEVYEMIEKYGKEASIEQKE